MSRQKINNGVAHDASISNWNTAGEMLSEAATYLLLKSSELYNALPPASQCWEQSTALYNAAISGKLYESAKKDLGEFGKVVLNQAKLIAASAITMTINGVQNIYNALPSVSKDWANAKEQSTVLYNAAISSKLYESAKKDLGEFGKVVLNQATYAYGSIIAPVASYVNNNVMSGENINSISQDVVTVARCLVTAAKVSESVATYMTFEYAPKAASELYNALPFKTALHDAAVVTQKDLGEFVVSTASKAYKMLPDNVKSIAEGYINSLAGYVNKLADYIDVPAAANGRS